MNRNIIIIIQILKKTIVIDMEEIEVMPIYIIMYGSVNLSASFTQKADEKIFYRVVLKSEVIPVQVLDYRL